MLSPARARAPWSRAAAALLLVAAAVLAPLRAQDDVRAASRAWLAALVPAADDPDATVASLLALARTQPGSPLVAPALADANRWIGLVQRPQPLLATVEALAAEPLHGLVAQELAVLRWRLRRAVLGDEAAGSWPVLGHAERLVACGPFGDAGDDFAGVPFAPELVFPPVGATLPGRGTLATTRIAARRADSHRVQLAAPPAHRQGVWYGSWRVVAERDVEGFLEVELDGDCQVFADGKEVLRTARWRGGASVRRYVGLALPAGAHELIVKTTTNGRSTVGLRCLGADGHPLAGLRSAGDADGDAAIAPGAPAARTAATFATPEASWHGLAQAADADPAVRIAAVLAHVRDGNQEAAIDLVEPLRAAPPDEPLLALALARVLRDVALPDELRKAAARALEERAAAALLPDHHAARLATALHAEDQDQREDALRLLAAHPAPGPETFGRRAEVLRALRFTAEIQPLLHEWAAACPHDSRPLAQLAQELHNAGAVERAAELRARALQLRPDQPSLAQTMCRAAMARRDVDAALLAAAWPAYGGAVPLGRLRLELDWATARGDTARAAELRTTLAAHPDADAALLLDLAGRHERLGERDAVAHCLRRAEAIEPRPATRAWLAHTTGGTTDVDELERFRRDGRAAIAAFVPGAAEQRSSMSLLIDQQILLVHADGSWTMEVHALRRINDQAGVEAFGQGLGLGDVDELLLLRTLTPDGAESVPAKVEGDYALQRLAPGSFVEWRYREHGGPPGPGVVATQPFVFGAADEPTGVAELVVVLPTGRGELRVRGLGEPGATATLADGRTVHVHTRTDIAPLPKENFVPPMLEVLPCAQVGEDAAPFATLRGQRVQLGRRTRLSAPLHAALAELPGADAEPAARAAAIWSHVQTTIEDGNADDALQTVLRKKGSRFLLAVALLRAAGFDVLPLACRDTRAELQPDGESLFAGAAAVQLPGALLLLPDGRRLPLFVDTPRHWPLGRVPAQRAGTTAWIVHEDHAEPFVLPGAQERVQQVGVRGRATVRGKELVLEAQVALGDVQGFQLAEQIRQLKSDVRKLAARQIAQQVFQGWRVEAAAIAGLEPGEAPRLDATVKRSGVQKDGERFVVPLPLPPTRFATTFGDRAERTLPWQLPIDLAGDWLIELDPGDELRVARLPEPVAIAEEPLQFVLDVRPADGRLLCRRTIRIGAATRPAVAFTDWLRALAAADRAEQATIELAARPAK